MTNKDRDRIHMMVRFESEWSDAVDVVREHQRDSSPMLFDKVNDYYYQHKKRIHSERYPKSSHKWVW